jgi:hypothetical protein
MARFDGDTVAELMALWPSDAEFAREAGIAPKHAHAMKRRGSIPDEYRLASWTPPSVAGLWA